MYHFFIEPGQVSADTIEIHGGDVNHIKNVLRMKPGEMVTVSDGFGHEYLCRVQMLLDDVVKAEIVEQREVSSELSSRLVLFQCLPKGDKMELIIQKAVELGAYAIVPVASRRCVVRLDKKKEENKRKRWQAIAEGAAKQSGRAIVPEIFSVVDFKAAVKESEKLDVRLIPYECAGEVLADGTESAMDKTRSILKEIQKGQSVGIFIGPEGGLEEAEVQTAVDAGVKVISLGKRILRTETAGLCILSVLMFQMEE